MILNGWRSAFRPKATTLSWSAHPGGTNTAGCATRCQTRNYVSLVRRPKMTLKCLYPIYSDDFDPATMPEVFIDVPEILGVYDDEWDDEDDDDWSDVDDDEDDDSDLEDEFDDDDDDDFDDE